MVSLFDAAPQTWAFVVLHVMASRSQAQRVSAWMAVRAGRAARCCPHPGRVKLQSRACHGVVLPVPEFTSMTQTPWSHPNIYFNKHWESFQRPVGRQLWKLTIEPLYKWSSRHSLLWLVLENNKTLRGFHNSRVLFVIPEALFKHIRTSLSSDWTVRHCGVKTIIASRLNTSVMKNSSALHTWFNKDS